MRLKQSCEKSIGHSNACRNIQCLGWSIHDQLTQNLNASEAMARNTCGVAKWSLGAGGPLRTICMKMFSLQTPLFYGKLPKRSVF